MFDQDRITAARHFISHDIRSRTRFKESEPYLEARKSYANAYLQYLIVNDVETTPKPERKNYGVRYNDSQFIEKRLLAILTGVKHHCSRCKEALGFENSTPYTINHGGRCQRCESDYHLELSGKEKSFSIPIPARVWEPFRTACNSRGEDPLIQLRIMIALETTRLEPR